MVRNHLSESRRVKTRGGQFVISEPVLYGWIVLSRSFVVQHQAEREGEDFLGHVQLVTRDRAKYRAWKILVYSIYPL